MDKSGYPPSMSFEEKNRTWPLKYKSTIVAPICPSIHEHRTNEKLLGFICVDSMDIGAFRDQTQNY